MAIARLTTLMSSSPSPSSISSSKSFISSFFFSFFLSFFAVAVSTITVMAGDRVELNCDVAVTTTMASASAVFDHRRQLIIDQRRGGESLYGIDSRSYVDVDGLHQHRHRRHQRQQKEKQITSSSSSSHLSRRRRASAATRKSGGGGGLTRVNYGGGSDHFIDADTDADDEDDDNGYLVLWFVDPERKPFYR